MLALSRTFVFLFCCLLMSPLTFGEGHGDHHHHGDEAAEDHSLSQLRLNNGKKWAADAPLKREMGKIRKLVIGPQKKDASKAAYTKLADQVHGSVMTMFQECKLPPEADANLHIILAEMLAGVSAMKGEVHGATHESGFQKVHQALEAYQSHFE